MNILEILYYKTATNWRKIEKKYIYIKAVKTNTYIQYLKNDKILHFWVSTLITVNGKK